MGNIKTDFKTVSRAIRILMDCSIDHVPLFVPEKKDEMATIVIMMLINQGDDVATSFLQIITGEDNIDISSMEYGEVESIISSFFSKSPLKTFSTVMKLLAERKKQRDMDIEKAMKANTEQISTALKESIKGKSPKEQIKVLTSILNTSGDLPKKD